MLAQGRHNAAQLRLHGLRRDVQLAGDLLVGHVPLGAHEVDQPPRVGQPVDHLGHLALQQAEIDILLRAVQPDGRGMGEEIDVVGRGDQPPRLLVDGVAGDDIKVGGEILVGAYLLAAFPELHKAELGDVLGQHLVAGHGADIVEDPADILVVDGRKGLLAAAIQANDL